MNAECAWVCCVLGGMSVSFLMHVGSSPINVQRVEQRVLVSGTALCGACAWGLHAFVRKVPGCYIFEGGCCIYSEKAMAPHSSTLTWKIPWMEEPGRLQSMGLLGVGHD